MAFIFTWIFPFKYNELRNFTVQDIAFSVFFY